jgi:hypothetical protein
VRTWGYSASDRRTTGPRHGSVQLDERWSNCRPSRSPHTQRAQARRRAPRTHPSALIPTPPGGCTISDPGDSAERWARTQVSSHDRSGRHDNPNVSPDPRVGRTPSWGPQNCTLKTWPPQPATVPWCRVSSRSARRSRAGSMDWAGRAPCFSPSFIGRTWWTNAVARGSSPAREQPDAPRPPGTRCR